MKEEKETQVGLKLGVVYGQSVSSLGWAVQIVHDLMQLLRSK
jgi:hypothetical protein